MTNNSSLFCSERSVAQKSNALFFVDQPSDRHTVSVGAETRFPSNQSAAEARSFMVDLLGLMTLPPGNRLQHIFCMNEQNRISRRRIIRWSRNWSVTRARQQSNPSILDISTEQFDRTMKTNHLCAILDNKGCFATFAAGIGNYRNHIGAGL